MAPFTFTIRRAPVELTCEVGSIAEAIGILQTEDTTVRTLIATADDLNGSNGEAQAAPSGDAPAAAAEAPKPRKPRGSNKDKGDPANAAAPAPEAIPGTATAAPTAPVNTAPGSNGLPTFLDRTSEAAATAAAPPPPPPAIPAAPPAPPAAPPSGVLAGKVIAELDKRAEAPGAADALAGWLAQCGLVKAGTTYSDAIDAVRMLADDKVAVVAGQLGVTA